MLKYPHQLARRSPYHWSSRIWGHPEVQSLDSLVAEEYQRQLCRPILLNILMKFDPHNPQIPSPTCSPQPISSFYEDNRLLWGTKFGLITSSEVWLISLPTYTPEHTYEVWSSQSSNTLTNLLCAVYLIDLARQQVILRCKGWTHPSLRSIIDSSADLYSWTYLWSLMLTILYYPHQPALHSLSHHSVRTIHYCKAQSFKSSLVQRHDWYLCGSILLTILMKFSPHNPLLPSPAGPRQPISSI